MWWLLWCFCLLLAESYETINHYHYADKIICRAKCSNFWQIFGIGIKMLFWNCRNPYLSSFFPCSHVCYTCRVALLRHFLGLPGRWVLQIYWPFWQVTDLGCIPKRISNGIGLSNNIFLKERFLIMHLFFLLFSLQFHEAPTMFGLKMFQTV